jgi:hypothetical protein
VSDLDDNSQMDTLAAPANDHNIRGFYVSGDTAAVTTWMTDMIFLYPNYRVPDPIPSEPTNLPRESVNKMNYRLQFSQL